MMLKTTLTVSLCLVLGLVGGTDAFLVPAPHRTHTISHPPFIVEEKQTILHAASGYGPRRGPKNDWVGKPLYSPRSIKPVASNKVLPIQRAMMEDVMIDPNYSLVWATFLLGPLIIWYHPCKLLYYYTILHCTILYCTLTSHSLTLASQPTPWMDLLR